MGCTLLCLPEKTSLPQLVEWNRQLWLPSNDLEVRIDFSQTTFFTPFAMMFIIQQVEHYKSKFGAATVSFCNTAHLTWPANMGFFSTLSGFALDSDGASPSPHVGSASYKFLPITTLSTREFMNASGRGLSDVNEAVDSESMRLTKTLTQLGSGYTFDTVQYSLREIMRNVFEHSGSPALRYCAQYWPNTRIVELIIADSGMGIYNSLIGNPAFRTIAERDALHFACLPGVSGNAGAINDRASGNPWRNSGYGLYMTSRLCRNDGNFLIISSNRALSLQPDTKTDFSIVNTKGTIIRLHLDLSTTQNLRANLIRYTDEGKSIAEGIRGAKVIDASVASQMLRRDFEQKAD